MKEPQFVILDKQKSAVHQGLVMFKAVEGLDGRHSALTLRCDVFMFQTLEDKAGQGKINEVK